MSLRSFTLLLLLAVFTINPAGAVMTPVNPATETPAETAALDAVREYKENLDAMSKKERRQFKKEQRKAVRNAIKDNRGADGNTVLLVILAVLIPFVAVLVHQGELNSKFWICLLLTLLFYLPGLIYALLTILG